MRKIEVAPASCLDDKRWLGEEAKPLCSQLACGSVDVDNDDAGTPRAEPDVSLRARSPKKRVNKESPIGTSDSSKEYGSVQFRRVL